jgi:MoxR-like ATPase
MGGLVEQRERSRDWEAFAARFGAIEENVERVVRGKRDEIRLAMVALVAEGHLLIEDVPGVGKTMLTVRSGGSNSPPTCSPPTSPA